MSVFQQPAPEPPTKLGVYRLLSPRAGVRVSPICLGGMSIGDDETWNTVYHSSPSLHVTDFFLSSWGPWTKRGA